MSSQATKLTLVSLTVGVCVPMQKARHLCTPFQTCAEMPPPPLPKHQVLEPRYTRVRMHAVNASRAVCARVRRALVDVVCALRPCPAACAHTRVLHHARNVRAAAIYTSAPVFARRRCAFLHGSTCLATCSGLITRVADTLMVPGTHVDALCTKGVAVILSTRARIHLCLTMTPGVSIFAGAPVHVHHICARCAVHARRRLTLIVVRQAAEAAVPQHTYATEGCNVVEASPAISARRRGAFIELSKARARRCVSEPRGAHTRVRS